MADQEIDPGRTLPTEGFHGRRRGKSLGSRQAHALEAMSALYGVGLDDDALSRPTDLFRTLVKSITLEIGFGGGEHLHHVASRSPGTGFIGAEPFLNGRAKLAELLADKPLANVRVYDDNAVELLERLPPASIARVFLLYPDPWPKPRHHKRRFVSAENLDRLARVMMPGGTFHFASDIDHYVNWTLAHVRRHPDFEWTAARAADWREPFPDWPGTRYEAKAIREGRIPAYLAFRRL